MEPATTWTRRGRGQRGIPAGSSGGLCRRWDWIRLLARSEGQTQGGSASAALADMLWARSRRLRPASCFPAAAGDSARGRLWAGLRPREWTEVQRAG